MQRPAQADGDEVGHVDERRDGAHADRQQPLLEPARARPVADAADVAPHEQRTDGGGGGSKVELDVHRARKRAGERLDGERLQRAQAGRREIAGDAVNAETVLAVGRDGDVEHGIVEAENAGERRADGRILGQFDDARMIVAEAHLALRAQHAVARLTADLGLLEPQAGAREGRARGGEHTFHAGPCVGRAAHDLDLLLAARIDQAEDELVGRRMAFHLEHMGDRERSELGRSIAQLLDLEPEVGQPFGDLGGGRARLEVLPEPAQRELHLPRPSASVGTASGRNP